MADRVFEDRLGLWIITPANLPGRLAAIRGFQGGIIRDLFLPRTAAAADFAAVRTRGLAAHLWVATDGLDPDELAERTLLDLSRLSPGALELNIELPADDPLPGYIDDVVGAIRRVRRSLRIRLNLATWKGFAAPVVRLLTDPNLYVCEGNYLGNMDELVSAADALADLTGHGVPDAKATVCYAAACKVLGSPARVRTLPDLTRTRRGVIFSDDLMVEAGLL